MARQVRRGETTMKLRARKDGGYSERCQAVLG